MKIISWNVAGFRACLKKGLPDFFNSEAADIFCFQEVKALKEQYEFNPPGYYEYLFPAKRKGYSGTLIYSKLKPLNVYYGIGASKFDDEGRTITLEYETFYLVNVYVPNAKPDLSRLTERMIFEDLFRTYLQKLNQKKPVIIGGDFNVAHCPIDLKHPETNAGKAGFTIEERTKFDSLLAAGFYDTYRYFNPEKKDAYTWWSYLNWSRSRNDGWRIDYFLVSRSLLNQVKDTIIYQTVLGSDHCPIGLVITFN